MEVQKQISKLEHCNSCEKGDGIPVSDSVLLTCACGPELKAGIQSLQVLLREILHVPLDFHVLLVDSSKSANRSIFSLLDFSKDLKGGFLDAGNRSSLAISQARKIFEVEVIGSSRESAFSYIPQCDWIPFDISFLHITSTEDIQANRISRFPKVSLPVICDRSADLFNNFISYDKFDLIYAHGGEGIIPENLSIVLIKDALRATTFSSIFNSKIGTKNSGCSEIKFEDLLSLIRSLHELKQNGGVMGNASHLDGLSKSLYLEIERNRQFQAVVNPRDRSMQAIRFYVTTPGDELLFGLLLDKRNLNILQRSPHGDFLILLNKCKEEQILRLLETMQEFERKPEREG